MYKFIISLIIITIILDNALGKKPLGHVKPRPTQNLQRSTAASGYSHESNTQLDNSEWMSNIDDSVLLSSLSIPGTHESLSLNGGDIVQCQTLTLEKQLKAGIRVLDIRCRHKENTFRISHDSLDQNIDFNQVLVSSVQFLVKNPNEVILMRVREEFRPEATNRTFEETFREYMTKDEFNPFIWEPKSVLPTLGEVRGKIIILQDFIARKSYGLDYSSFNVQDDSEVKSIFGLYDKWAKIKNQLMKAEKQKDGFFLNFLSGATGYLGQLPLLVLPYFVAGGRSDHRTNSPLLLTGRTTLINREVYPDFPRVLCMGSFCLVAFEGTNELTLRYIQDEKPEFVGILMIDFPGDALIDAIIKLNKLSDLLLDKQMESPKKYSPNEQTLLNSIEPTLVSYEDSSDNKDQLDLNQFNDSFLSTNINPYKESEPNESMHSFLYPESIQVNPNKTNSKSSPKPNSILYSKSKSKLASKGKMNRTSETSSQTDNKPLDPNKPLELTEEETDSEYSPEKEENSETEAEIMSTQLNDNPTENTVSNPTENTVSNPTENTASNPFIGPINTLVENITIGEERLEERDSTVVSTEDSNTRVDSEKNGILENDSLIDSGHYTTENDPDPSIN